MCSVHFVFFSKKHTGFERPPVDSQVLSAYRRQGLGLDEATWISAMEALPTEISQKSMLKPGHPRQIDHAIHVTMRLEGVSLEQLTRARQTEATGTPALWAPSWREDHGWLVLGSVLEQFREREPFFQRYTWSHRP